MTIIGGSRSLEPRVIGGGLQALQQDVGGFPTSFSNSRAGNMYSGISAVEGPRFDRGVSRPGPSAVIEGSRFDMIEGPRFESRPITGGAPDLVTSPELFVGGGMGIGGFSQQPFGGSVSAQAFGGNVQMAMPQQTMGGSVRMAMPQQQVLVQPMQQETWPQMQMQRPLVNTAMAMDERMGPSFVETVPRVIGAEALPRMGASFVESAPRIMAPSPSFPLMETSMPVSPQVYAARVLGGGIQSQGTPGFKQVVAPTPIMGGAQGGAQVIHRQGGAQIQYAAPTQIFDGIAPFANGETVVSSVAVSRPDLMAQGHIVRPEQGGRMAGVDIVPAAVPQEQPKCAILTIPDEYMGHISQNDLLEIQELCGSSIQYMQPDPESGNLDWEVRVYGPDQARKESHEILEQRLNERLAAQSSQPVPEIQEDPQMQASLMTLPDACMQFFYQDDWRAVKEVTGCEVDVFEPDPALANDEWQVRFTGSQEGLEQANKMVDNILQERIAEQQQAQTEDLARTLPMVQPGATMVEGTVDTLPPMETMVADSTYTGDMQPEQPMQTVSMPTTVLPVPEEYLRMLTQEDLDNLMNGIGCAIKINDPEPGRDEYNFVIYGTKEQRDECHAQIEDILTRRQSELMEMQEGETDPMEARGREGELIEMYNEMEVRDGAMYETMEVRDGPVGEDPNGQYEVGVDRYYDEQAVAYDEQAMADNLVPCTVLPIPHEYLEMLDNLDDICNSTGCQMKVSEGNNDGEWQLSLFGNEQQRDDAHAAIEYRINEVLGTLNNP